MRDRVFFFLMIRRPPRSTLDRSSAASDVYKRQACLLAGMDDYISKPIRVEALVNALSKTHSLVSAPVSYTHLRAHETVLDLVCRLLLENKNQNSNTIHTHTKDKHQLSRSPCSMYVLIVTNGKIG